MGACCNGATCTITRHIDCQGSGQSFKGIGTVCSPNPCSGCDPCPGKTLPDFVTVSIHVDIAHANTQAGRTGVTGEHLESRVGGTYILPVVSSDETFRIFDYFSSGLTFPPLNGTNVTVVFFTCNVNFSNGFAVKGDMYTAVSLESEINGRNRINLAGFDGAPFASPRANMCSGVSHSQRMVLNYNLGTFASTFADVTVTP